MGKLHRVVVSLSAKGLNVDFLYLQPTDKVSDYVLIILFHINRQCIVSVVVKDLHVL